MTKKITEKSISRSASGKIYVADKNNKKYLVNPALIRQQNTAFKRRKASEGNENFKLVTVRRLTEQTVASVTAELKAAQAQLEAAALRSNQPVPFPSTPPMQEAELVDYYAVYVDEDITNHKTPIYTFQSPSPKIKCFITANGSGKEDWSVHIFHLTSREINPDGTFKVKWRLYSIDNRLPNLPGRVDYLLESSSLPQCFENNYDVENISYLGGGCWILMGLDSDDRLPIIASAPSEKADKYINIGAPMRFQGQGQIMSIVAYSLTPTYSVTWCRGITKQNKREKTFYQDPGLSTYKNSGVIETTRSHEYKLDLHYRPVLSDSTQTIKESKKQEYSSGSATYVGNTNSSVGSMYQSPDYGTDVKRCAISKYTMETNVIRPSQLIYNVELPKGKISYQANGILPVLCASNNMSDFLYIDFGIAKGSIFHDYEAKSGGGSRGYDYFDSYKYWWGYGKIIGLEPTDEGRYNYPKSANTIPGIPARVRIGSMYDLGTISIDADKPNRIFMSWDSLPNPQTGFFGIHKGLMSFTYTYLNPPLIGHQGPFYYEIQPADIGAYGGTYNNSFGSVVGAGNDAGFGATFVGGSKYGDLQSRQSELMFAYSQLAGAIGGGGLTSMNIGFVYTAVNDGASIVLREPNEEMSAYLRSYPETFPHNSIGGFWAADLMQVDIGNDGHGTIIYYDSNANPIKTETI